MAERGIQVAVARADLFLTTAARLALPGIAIVGLVLILWKMIMPAIRHNHRSCVRREYAADENRILQGRGG